VDNIKTIGKKNCQDDNVIHRLKPKSEFSRNVLTLMAGSTIAQAIPIAISPILTRIYTPDDFGLLALFISIASIMAVISTGKYELSIILPKLDTYGFQLLSLSMIIAFGASIFYSLTTFTLSIIYSFDSIFLLLPITVFFIALNNIFDRYNNRIKNYKLMSYQRIVKTTVESFTGISLMVFLSIKNGMIFGLICGYCISSFSMFFVNYKSFTKSKLKPSLNAINFLARRYVNFPKYNMPQAFFNTLSGSIPIFLIPVFYTTSTLGLYAFGLRIVQAPLSLITSSMFNVLGQKMAEEYSSGNEINTMFKDVSLKLFIIALLIVPFFVYMKNIFAFTFGNEWEQAGYYIQIMSPWILLVFIVSPLATIPQIYNEQKKALNIEIIRIILQIIIFIIGGLHLSIENTLFILSLFSSIVLMYSFNWYYQLTIRNKKI
jgi:O-antigen/teichoic acid export membrane protein